MDCENNTHAMTLVVVSKKNTHAVTLVDPYVVSEKNTNAMTLVVVYENNAQAMTLDVVYEDNTHAMNSSGSMWFIKRTHMQISPMDQCGLGKEHTCKCHQWLNMF